VGILIVVDVSSALQTWRGLRATVLAGIIGTLAVLAGGAPVGSVALAADPSSDIPGVALAGPVAAGRLGGAIYDVVYRLSVPPGHVIVASVAGTEGTDFDIYLFDYSATTVLSNAGLVTKSTGPTSSESISWPSRLGGTYYIDLNGATDVEGDYRLTVQTVPDPTPPALSIALAGGRILSNQLTVPVALSATEDLSGVTEMALSADGTSFGAWQPFQTSTTWTFEGGEGPRTVWAKVRNGVGLESAPATDSVIIDTTSPSVIQLDPSPGSTVAGLRPAFRVTFNEPINLPTWTDLGLVVQSATGSLVGGTYTYESAKRVGTFVPSESLQAGASYIVNVGLVRDLAGNIVAPLASWSVTPLAPTSLKAEAMPRVLSLGGSTKIRVQFSGAPPPTTVEMLASSVGGPFEPVSTFELVNGELSLSLAPARNTTYRFRYSGSFGVAPTEGDVRVLVRRSVRLVGRSSPIISQAKVGASVRLVAAVDPAAAGTSVSFRLYRFDSVRRTWVYAGSKGRNTDANGRAALTWIPPAVGSFYWRVSVASTAEFANDISPVYRWSISR
jgi:hypothetical protein